MSSSKQIIVSVTTDLVTDQRVHKVCSSLHENGYEVLLIGRKYANSLPLEKRNYQCKRMGLWFNRGFLFYANYNIKLFFLLYFKKCNILLANDLDTLLANFLASKLKRVELVYDSHEYFTEVPELINRPRIKAFWERLEGILLPKLKNCYTVTQRIAMIYNEKYNSNFQVVRNFPQSFILNKGIEKEGIIIYQGAINIGRGLEELIDAMEFVANGQLWIVGEGDIMGELSAKVDEKKLNDKVRFWGRKNIEQLRELTNKAKVGISIEKKEGLNYTYALPNKVFDYIHSNVPVLYSDLEEVKQTLNGYEVGEELIAYEPKVLAEQLNKMLTSSKYDLWVNECKRASKELNWKQEEKFLLSIFDSL